MSDFTPQQMPLIPTQVKQNDLQRILKSFASRLLNLERSAFMPGDGWHIVGNTGEPAFGSVNWTSLASYGPVAFRKDGNRVIVQGMVRVGGGGIAAGVGSATPIFTFPSGYRHLSGTAKQFLGAANGSGVTGFVLLNITSAGVLTMQYNSVALAAGSNFCLDMIDFIAEA